MVSVIIPTFNRENLIKETLNSLLTQSYQNWEAIVIDDGSNDNTCITIEEYSEFDVRVKLVVRNREPKGASTCRNIGIECSKGDYLIFLDSDDILAEECLEKRVKYMQSNAELDFAVFQTGTITFQGEYINSGIVKKSDNYLYSFLKHDLPWQTTSPIWKASFIKNNDIKFNENYPRLQDPEFNTNVLLKDNAVFVVLWDSQTDCYYRNNTNKVFNVTILLHGFAFYLKDFSSKIKNREDYLVCRLQLKKCYVEAIKGLYSYYKPEFHSECLLLTKEIIDIACVNQLITRKLEVLTHVIVLMYEMRFTRIPFGKYVLRLIMLLIKKS